MTALAPGAADAMDAALRCVRDVETRVRAVIATSDRLIDETAWQARAVADYRRGAALWQWELRAVAAELLDHERDLRALCAAAHAAEGTASPG